MLPLHLFWWIFAVAQGVAIDCPVSHSYGASQHFHGYPLSIFFPDEVSHSDSRSCNVVNDNDQTATPIQQCDNRGLCPVRVRNIRSALQVAPWPQYAEALKQLGGVGNINVFYLGGSMTQGTEAGRKCIANGVVPKDIYQPPASSSVCSWPSHISRWLRQAYPATKFHFHDFSAGGRTSQSSDYFIDMVRSSKANLSSPSLFFLDYSVNDAQAHIFSGIETFMCTIIGYFGKHYHIKPTIVVIEQFPHANFQGSATDEGLHTDVDYAMAYRRISQHYGAVLISVREVFWTYFGLPEGRNISHPNITQRYYPISPFEPNVHMWVHPPWYVQLYVADVLAACLLHITAQFKSSTTDNANTVHNLHNHTALPIVTYTPISHELPAPLYDNSAETKHMCDLAVPYAIDATPHSLQHTSRLNITQGWGLTRLHNAAGWMINSHALMDKRTLSFPFQGPADKLRKHILKVTYLRSYEGMGMANLSLCGLPLSQPVTLDGLWSYPVSLPQIYSAVLSDEDILRCQSLPASRHTVDIVYEPGANELAVRSKHKHQFKIFDLHVCAPIQFQI